ncbi:FecR family protein [Membranihabitans marinus]|uniref:FecR family protein n=1 Tax=Membranihabitans marinus TaxID=1227546 RepID=UPI001F3C53AC|nr:FecR domain-containing protein [Membranihabitans marinus]
MNKNYTIEELISDKSFKSFVLQSNPEDVAKWQSIIHDQPHQKEIFEEAQLIVAHLKIETPNIDPNAPAAIWEKINQNIEVHQPSKTRKLIYWTSIAASLLLLIYLGINTLFYNTTFYTAQGQTQLVSLPDNSTVLLNSESSISFNKRNWNLDRRVDLSGEAYFNVAKGSDFTVDSKQGSTKVLGTTFTVYARQENYIVRCYTGKVSVQVNKNDNILLPGEMYSTFYNNAKTTFDTAAQSQWMNGFFRFDNMPVEEVFAEMERQYKVNIEIPEHLKHMKYTGFFERNDLEKALSNVCWPLNLQYVIHGNRVTIKNVDE